MRSRLVRVSLAALKIGLAAGLLVYLARSGRIRLESVRAMFGGGHLPWVLAAAALFLAAQGIAAARVRVLLLASGIPAGFGLCFRLTMTGFLFNSVIPGAVGGDLVKIHLLLRLPAEARGRGPGAILMDRLLGAMALITLAGLSILHLQGRLGDAMKPYAKGLMSLGIGAVVLVGGVLALLICSREPRIRSFIKGKLRSILPQGLVYDAAEGLGRVSKNTGALAKAFLLSLLLQLVGLSALLTLARTAEGVLPPLLDMAAVSVIVMLAGTIPVTPGNIGWTEFLAMMGWAALGSQAGAAVMLNMRVLTTLCSLPWGILYLMGRGARHPAADPA